MLDRRPDDHRSTSIGNTTMQRVLIEYRFVISLALSAVIGTAGLHAWPFPLQNALLGLVAASRPALYASLAYGYATVWFSTPFFALNVLFLADVHLCNACGSANQFGAAPAVSTIGESR